MAVFGSIGVVIYRGMLGRALPVGLTPDVASVAMSTLGGAVAVSGELPATLGAALVDAARDAFLRGVVLCAIISGVGYLALAAFAAWTFRRATVLPQHTTEHEVEAVA
jgi:DHA2 family multidrug resistance protein-like MFS transporter